MKNYTKSKVIVVIIGASCILLSLVIPTKKHSNPTIYVEDITTSAPALEIVEFEETTVGTKFQVAPIVTSTEETTTTTAVETETETEPETSTTVEESTTEEAFIVPQYSVNGSVLDPDLNDYLYYKLEEYGIAWWHQYALIQAYQESRFNIYAEAPNGLDKGLFQFRILYWANSCKAYGLDTRDIFDPYAQIDLYCIMVYKRLNKGLSENEVISAHYTGGYGYSDTYVQQVKQWSAHIGQIN